MGGILPAMSSLRFGLIYDLLGSLPARPGDPPDADAEYEPEETVRALEQAVAWLGHSPVRIGSAHALLDRLGKGELALDAALSIAEGYGSRNREAWALALLEMAGVPALGSDALTLSTSLDKLWTHQRVAAAGVPTPDPHSLASVEEAKIFGRSATYPLFVKPRWEGTAKGIAPTSRVTDGAALVREVARVVAAYGQPALVERFLPGPEYTVSVVGHAPPRALPVLQRALEADTGIGVHALARHAPPEGFRAVTPGTLDAPLEAALQQLALRAFDALECLDFARADFRLDDAGRPVFLEINPLPTFAPDGSFGILAELEGRPHVELLAEVLGAALERLGLA